MLGFLQEGLNLGGILPAGQFEQIPQLIQTLAGIVVVPQLVVCHGEKRDVCGMFRVGGERLYGGGELTRAILCHAECVTQRPVVGRQFDGALGPGQRLRVG